MLKANNKDSKTSSMTSSSVFNSSGVFIVNFEHISHPFLVFFLLSLNRESFPE